MNNVTIPYLVIEAAVRGDTDAVNEVIRRYYGYTAALAGGQAVTKTATTVPMWMKNFADAWKRN